MADRHGFTEGKVYDLAHIQAQLPASAALVVVGLYVRLTIHETPVFQAALNRRERVRLPILVVVRDPNATNGPGALLASTLLEWAGNTQESTIKEEEEETPI